MNKLKVTIGIIMCLSGIILFGVLSQPLTDEAPIIRYPDDLPDDLYLTLLLPASILLAGIWIIVDSFRKGYERTRY